MGALALFDLDHTLLSGDSDVLWCDFLMQEGLLDRRLFEPRNIEMSQRYRQGSVTVEEFCNFYVGTLAGHKAAGLQALRQRFLDEVVAPRIPAQAHALVESHRRRGDTLVLTTATNRVLTELTASHLDIAHLIATEVEQADGCFTGRTVGPPNMREGKVTRLLQWLQGAGLHAAAMADATFYSDSANDLPLLKAVGHPVAVDPDEVLGEVARREGWRVLKLSR